MKPLNNPQRNYSMVPPQLVIEGNSAYTAEPQSPVSRLGCLFHWDIVTPPYLTADFSHGFKVISVQYLVVEGPGL